MFFALFSAALALPIPLGAAPGGGVEFAVGSSAGPTKGHLDVFEAQLDLEARTGFFEGQAGTLSTGLGPRDQRLLYYALEVATFPTIRFDLRKIEGSASELVSRSGSGAVRLVGSLTIRDVALPITIPSTFAWEAEKLRLTGETTLDWASFGVPDPSVLIAKVEPAVSVSFDLAGSPP